MKIFAKYELDCAVIGKVTTTGKLVVKKNGKVEAEMPVEPMVTQSPEYDRPWTKTPARPVLEADKVPAHDPGQALKALMSSPDLASRRWIWEQYDHLVRGHTIQRPGGDAAVVRVPGTNKALAITTDCTPRYVYADPETGGMQAVAESWRNLTAVGAKPLAITDNMNFGNPERPEIMGQFVGAIAGMRAACLALDYPVVSGNVSLYNETQGQAILPAPAIGGVGLLPDATKSAGVAFRQTGDTIILIGETQGWLGASLYVRELCRKDPVAKQVWAPPPVDLGWEKRNGGLVRAVIEGELVSASHDVSDGGLLVALAEMALAGNIGFDITTPDDAPALHAFLFGEDQGRYLLAAPDPQPILASAHAVGVTATVLGRTTAGGTLTLNGRVLISIKELREAHEGWLPSFMAAR
jgi:phosphoribosylformylglycinamidine synthase